MPPARRPGGLVEGAFSVEQDDPAPELTSVFLGVLLQVSALDPPSAMLSMSAVRLAVTAGPTEMVTESLATAPPAPTQDNV